LCTVRKICNAGPQTKIMKSSSCFYFLIQIIGNSQDRHTCA
jgi:hypothetical protein